MRTISNLILLLTSSVNCITGLSAISANDGFLTVPQLLQKYGYPNEVHTVETLDGYLLQMHRLPQKDGIPVLLVHGLFMSSAAYVISGPKNALAYILWDLGYDVWLANTRGNIYSRKHINRSPKKSAFWDFSFHELGTYDVPAMIDYVTKNTGFDKIHYIGHSQGSSALFVMCHQRPDHCEKVRSVNALAPAVYLKYLRSPIIRLLSKCVKTFQFLFKIIGMKEFSPNGVIMRQICKEEAITERLCKSMLYLIYGYDSEQLNKKMIPVILSHAQDGASFKQLLHFGQLIKSGNFQMYDYGLIKNRKRYGKWTPPNYDLKKTTIPVAIHYSLDDSFVERRGVLRLSYELPNVIIRNLIPIPKFNHLNFIFGTDSKTAIYDVIVKFMKSMEK